MHTASAIWWCVFTVLAGVAAQESRPNSNENVYEDRVGEKRIHKLVIGGKERNVTLYTKSVRNHNSGARYYMRYASNKATLETFGYSFYRVGGHYRSGYGYRLNEPPASYAPVFEGADYQFYPPMFLYYYRTEAKYFENGKPKYVCENEKAFWPLESETSEFVDSQLPLVRLADFDQYLPDPPEDDSQTGAYSPSSRKDASERELTVLSSLLRSRSFNSSDNSLVPYEVIDGFYPYTEYLQRFGSIRVSRNLTQSGNSSKLYIRAYRYFVCPDGKDPDETYCCGAPAAQFCCTFGDHVTFRYGTLLTIGGIILAIALMILGIASLFTKKSLRRINAAWGLGNRREEEAAVRLRSF